MIPVARSATPRILASKATQWLNTLYAATTSQERTRAQQKYRHKQIREALQQMFHGKCAYCESYIVHVSDAHIEHYRPKAKFLHLTFHWDNLFLACGKCNGAGYKGEKFPEANEGGPLVNPCTDIPAQHFMFSYDAGTRMASVYGQTIRGRTTETLLGLNRPELRQYRSRLVTRLAVLARFAPTDPKALQLLEEAKQDDAEYAAFARAF